MVNPFSVVEIAAIAADIATSTLSLKFLCNFRGYFSECTILNVSHSNTDQCNIAGKASDMHVEVSLNVSQSNTDQCNIAGKASDMRVEESLNVSHSNTDQCNIAGGASDMHSKVRLETEA